MITKEKKQKLIQDFSNSAHDTGSSAVQVAIITKRIEEVSEHLKLNKKDNGGRLGLIKMVNQRRSLLRYLERKSPDLYRQVIQKLGIRK